MAFKIGDYVCSRYDGDPATARIYQIVEIKPYQNSTRPDSVTAYGILDYSCNPAPRWGSFSMSTSTEKLIHVSELLILARAGEGEHPTGRPQHFVDLGVWTKEDRDEIVWGKRYP